MEFARPGGGQSRACCLAVAFAALALDTHRVGPAAVELLDHAAEDLLLAPEASPETEEIAADAAVALTRMTLRGLAASATRQVAVAG